MNGLQYNPGSGTGTGTNGEPPADPPADPPMQGMVPAEQVAVDEIAEWTAAAGALGSALRDVKTSESAKAETVKATEAARAAMEAASGHEATAQSNVAVAKTAAVVEVDGCVAALNNIRAALSS